MTETKQEVFEDALDQIDAAWNHSNTISDDELRARYAAATDAPHPDYDIHTDLDGDRYQLMTGREFIAALADDAMQDEIIGDSYPDISEIIPDVQYKAYLDGNAGALNGEWEEV